MFCLVRILLLVPNTKEMNICSWGKQVSVNKYVIICGKTRQEQFL